MKRQKEVKQNKVYIGVNLSPDLAKQLKTKASNERRSVSNMLICILEKEVKSGCLKMVALVFSAFFVLG